jgi:hypothetical protein
MSAISSGKRGAGGRVAVKRVFALLVPVALATGTMGCTMTQKVASGAGVGAVTGFAVGGPIGAGIGAVAGGVAVPVAMSD